MYTIVELKTQIRNLITMIINKDRKNINKWKNQELWYTDDGIISDVDTFYHLFNYIQHQGGNNNFMDYAKFIDDEDQFNSECKWRSIKKRNEFFNTFLMA